MNSLDDGPYNQIWGSDTIREPRRCSVWSSLASVRFTTATFSAAFSGLIITPGFWIGTGGLFGWPFHLISAYTAYNRAQKKNSIAV